MRYYGKVLGLLAGLAFYRHPGAALFGALIGHAFDAGWFTRRAPDPYRVLGLDENASEFEIERAYRRLMALHHPDRLSDLPAKQRAEAEAKASELNAAFDAIKKLRAER